ncbi:PQQ-dependent sugar dehydrogenase [Microbulbifer magnicolonia]|uniref:PQQ-dependent sugar dehydrogenase n=1 Tax=Microbulbifer magnicolonia TaxID=3109744 RepID=UPI002B416B54|nr:PQQ-dependent sugar dehydrogenase [Microbulbifer sp. GG15]
MRFSLFIAAAAFSVSAAVRAEISLPQGFTATVFADQLGATRHLAVADNGVVYASLMRPEQGHGLVALVDSDGDGSADQREYFGEGSGTGLAIHDGHLYFSSDTEVKRVPLAAMPVPGAAPQTIVSGFAPQSQHATKPMTFDGKGNMYVTVGAPSNACQKQARTPGSPGLEPCPQLESQSGIWRFADDKPGQRHGVDGERYATGIRNGLAMDWNHSAGALYFASHGRDQLSQLFPKYYNDAQNAELPAEEFHRATPGGDYGWPYTYWDPMAKARMVAPEYGGDGRKRAAAGKYPEPLLGLPAHWAPNDLIFYTADKFPAEYRHGAFIAFHGSWNRAPLPQAGFNVVFVPMNGAGQVSGEWKVFADGFRGEDSNYRPTGLAQGPDGALYIADDRYGRIWKVTYSG